MESVPSWSLNSIYAGKYVTCQVVVSATQRNITGKNSWDQGVGEKTARALGMLREGLSEGKSLWRRQEAYRFLGEEHSKRRRKHAKALRCLAYLRRSGVRSS